MEYKKLDEVELPKGWRYYPADLYAKLQICQSYLPNPPIVRAFGHRRWRSFSRRQPLDRLPAQLLSTRPRARSPFRRLFLASLEKAFDAKKLTFYGRFARLCDRRAFQRHLARARKPGWCVYVKRPFGGPEPSAFAGKTIATSAGRRP